MWEWRAENIILVGGQFIDMVRLHVIPCLNALDHYYGDNDNNDS